MCTERIYLPDCEQSSVGGVVGPVPPVRLPGPALQPSQSTPRAGGDDARQGGGSPTQGKQKTFQTPIDKGEKRGRNPKI